MDLRSVAVLFLWEGGEREKYAREACAACRRGFVGGWLLGCRESAKSVFQKSELASLRQRIFEKQRRFPPAKNQLPSCRVVANRHPSPRLFGSGREVVVGVWGDWRKWGLMRAGGLSGFPGVG